MRWKFFWLGLATTVVTFALAMWWGNLARRLLGQPHFVYDLQPVWLKTVQRVLGYLPWLVGAGLLGLKLFGRLEIRIGAYALGAFLPFGVFLVWLLAGPAVSNWWHRERFDAAGWRAPPDTSEVFCPTRLRMVDDLLARRVLPGLTRDSVMALLGPPDRAANDSTATITYHLGPERSWLRIDAEVLKVELDAGGRVVSASTMTY